MKKLKLQDVKKYIEENIGSFHEAREKGIKELKLSKILSSKNPYLFKAKNINTSDKIVRTLVNAHLSSQEETCLVVFLNDLLSMFATIFTVVKNHLLKELILNLKRME